MCHQINLSSQVIKGGFWVFAFRILEKLLHFIRLIILARLLAPNDFGLFGIALLSMSCLETFSETGFEQALIQKKQGISQYLDTAWTAQLLRAAFLACLLFIAAPAIGLFFNSLKAVILIRTVALAVLFKGLTNIKTIYFIKEMKFNKQFAYQSIGVIAEFVVAVSLVIILKNVWAMIFGLLANHLVSLLVSYLIYPYRPRLSFDLKKFKELFGFGKWVLGSGILIFLVTQGDDIFVGKLLGIAALGFYQLAYRISNMPATEIAHVISQVTFPAYSKLQDNIHKLREAYLKVLWVTAFLTFPTAGLIFILAPDFTRIFLGEKWMPMVPAMQMLVFTGLARSIAATTGSIFYALGKPKIETKWQVIRLFVLAILIYPFTIRWEILGTAAAVFVSIFVSTVGFSKEAIKITGCKVKEFGKMIILPLINGLSVIFIITFLKIKVINVGVLEFGLFICSGCLIILSLTYLFDKLFNYKTRFLMRDLYVSLKGSNKR